VRAEVIAGRMSLKEAQQIFVPDWTSTFKKMGLDKCSAIQVDEDIQ